MTKLLFLLIPFILISCGEQKKNGAAEAQKTGYTTESAFKGFFYFDTLKGTYMGDLGDSPLTLNITFISEDHATGYNIVKGNRRNLSGKVIQEEKEIILKLTEPGDDKFDGTFTLHIPRADFKVITGEWESQSGEVKTVALKKQEFDYKDGERRFAMYGATYTDSIGELYFLTDGTCNYEYVLNAGQANEQMKRVKGSWKEQNQKVTVFWQPNSVFSNRKIVFQIDSLTTDEEYGYKQSILKGDNRTFEELFYN